MRLDTERLILRPLEQGDAEDLYAVHSEPSTFQYIGSPPAQSLDDTRARIARAAAHFEEHGYATEAARAWLSYGFETLGLERIVAVAWPENTASWRVMEKCGMTLAGRGHHYGHETVIYELTRAEFEARAG